MIKSYLKTAFRNLIRRKTFSLINIFGLALGISACLIIYSYVTYEKSYDTFNENADNIYRLKNVRYYASGTDSSAGCVALLGPTLEEEIPEVINFARVNRKSTVVTCNNNSFHEHNMFWADSSFLTMFSFPLISGNVDNALSERYSAVLTKNTVEKYFGDKNAIGETIRLEGMDFKITGIAENVPPNSHINFDILLSFNTQFNDWYCWDCNNNNTYIQVTPGAKKSSIESKLPSIVSKLHNVKENGFDRAYFIQPLKDIHLHSNLRFEHEENGNANTIYFLSLIAIIILLLAWINYINLSTARSFERAKEVGLRKVIGAGYWALVRQFLLESFIINLLAVLISFFIVEITCPFWNEIVGMPSSFSLWENIDLIMLLPVLVFISPVVAGIYPAFVLSSYSPVSILKGNFKSSLKGILLRKGLVIFQFSISIILIAVIIVFGQQLSFMLNKNLGFNIEQKLVVNAPANIERGKDRTSACKTFINELRNQSLIEDATFSSVIPGMENGEVTGGIRQSEQSYEQGKQVYFVYVAQNYLDFFNIDLLCGRNFFESELKGLYQNGYKAKGLIINESAAKEFGFAAPEKALGASIFSGNDKIGEVMGVIKDYHQQSLDKEIAPSIFEGVTRGNFFIFSINTEGLSEKIESIKSNYAKMFHGNPFEYNFLDEFFDRQYNADIQTAEILGMFTFLSIFISCLGLVGLSSLMTIHRTKEIGVRKVLGASVQSLLILLSKEFIKWLVIANVIAYPVAYYFMNKWLENFAYRIDISWWVFVLSGGLALLIALTTVGFQAIKASIANPVEALRYE
ncbi:MAG: ABC transporter permease [Ignavibacteria bacterium]|jgi:putative ABC transport system permease protein